MRPSVAILAILGLALGMAACANPTKTKENMLSSSGFKAAAPRTAAQLAAFKALSPHKLAKTTFNGKTAWVYADPTICGCLYVGNQQAHDAYVKKVAQAKATDESEAANAHAALTSMQDLGLGAF